MGVELGLDEFLCGGAFCAWGAATQNGFSDSEFHWKCHWGWHLMLQSSHCRSGILREHGGLPLDSGWSAVSSMCIWGSIEAVNLWDFDTSISLFNISLSSRISSSSSQSRLTRCVVSGLVDSELSCLLSGAGFLFYIVNLLLAEHLCFGCWQCCIPIDVARYSHFLPICRVGSALRLELD